MFYTGVLNYFLFSLNFNDLNILRLIINKKIRNNLIWTFTKTK